MIIPPRGMEFFFEKELLIAGEGGNQERFHFSKFFQGDAYLVFHGFDGNVEQRGYFPVFEAVFLYQPENQPALRGKLADSGVNMPHHFVADELRFGVCFVFGHLRFIEMDRFFMCVFTEIIKGDVAGSRIEIPFQVGYLVKVIPFFPYRNKYIRYNFFGHFPCMNNCHCQLQQ